jgi:Kef-type K+ transport system membrane component KefB
VIGNFLVPPLFALLERIGKDHTLAIMGFVLALILALLADRAGSALIIGAFAAGLVLAPTRQAPAIEKGIVRIGGIFVPIFFVAVGAAVDIRAFLEPSVLMLGISLTAVAVIGKIVAGYAPYWLSVKKLVIGVAMVPRGEVGLIFAQMGLTTGVLSTSNFSALMMMVLLTTFAAPIALKALLPPGSGSRDAAIGISELTSDA